MPEQLRRFFEEAGGSLADAQVNAAVFMLPYDNIWADLREAEKAGTVRRVDERWVLVSRPPVQEKSDG